MYSVKFCQSNWFNKVLIVQYPGRKCRQGQQTKDDGKEKDEARRHRPDVQRAKWSCCTEKRYHHVKEYK